jgi:toxin YoeB
MKLVFSEEAWEEYTSWLRRDRSVLKRANAVIHDVLRDPFTGIGKPEPLKHDLTGYWARRLTQEHRIVYKIEDGELWIAKVGRHYE